MSAAAIEAALKARLAEYADLPKAWPNQDFDPKDPGNMPYVACDLVRAGTSDRTLEGDAPETVGRLVATVVVAKGTSTGTANRHADAIAALFPRGQRIAAGELAVTVTQPPHIREGMTDGTYWRVPVAITFLAA
ncbi:phage tail terminator-like protein [Paracoccus benzoatiresistens]|uniref:Phage tail terminator-like protein n=1 Tax=Paracoccus benzoatiresistens TaxID=2997341 RepID=A0ABT4J9X8_9RHOB|nr:phage tail terminator-like protein [Paracoccus sp. EF6]MCZ0963886.1 phage tail terminator-like protein [Paracoccus sp. EF6]